MTTKKKRGRPKGTGVPRARVELKLPLLYVKKLKAYAKEKAITLTDAIIRIIEEVVF